MVNISIPTNLLIIMSAVILVIIIAIIIYIICKDRKNDQEEINDLIEDIVNAKPREEQVQVKQIENTEPKMDLESMLITMQNDLDKKEAKTVENFEKDQEANAIISYKELLKVADKVENYEKEQEDNAVISYKELTKLNSVDKLEEKTEQLKKSIAKIESPRETKDKKFKNTEFISPIYGKMDEHIEYPKIKAYNKEADLNFNEYFGQEVDEYDGELEKALNIEPLAKEVRTNDDFLKALKEFRNNL